MKPLLLAICGPTASGKTDLAIQLAIDFNTEVLSFDSRQCYRELNIGVARPSQQQLQEVAHHFVASHSIHTPVHAADFEQYGLQHLQQIFGKRSIAIAAGGTGLYLDALLGHLHTMPPVHEAIRQQIRQQYAEEGILWLQQEVRQRDPAFAAAGEMQNPHRMLRALEVVLSTGQSILTYRNAPAPERPFNTMLIGMDIPKPTLHQRITARTNWMFDNGLVEEAKALYPFRHLQALQTVGYREIWPHLEGKVSLQESISLVATHTRQYAKRQMTWFRKDKEIQWFHEADAAGITRLISQQFPDQLPH